MSSATIRIVPNIPRTLCVTFCCAFLSAQLSYRLRESTTAVMIEQDRAILSGNATLPEFQNRVLAPATFAAISRLSRGRLSDSQTWKATRLLTALVAFAAAYFCAWRLSGGDEGRTVAACALLLYAYAWTAMMHQWEHSSDFFDIAFICLAVFFAVQDRIAAIFAVAVVAAFNRESAAFAGLILGSQALTRSDIARSRIAWGLICTVASLAIVTGIRLWFSGHHTERQMLGIVVTVREWRWLLHPYGAGASGVAMFVPLGLILARQTQPWTATQRGLLIAAAAVAAIPLSSEASGSCVCFFRCT